ncbi:MAG: hypothetical protein GY749_48190 [Desulfobacteraceae bacterium]|nr:hypothetical protein [Desulfobacteraceae bacterium]
MRQTRQPQQQPITCHICQGNGFIGQYECPQCQGYGYIPQAPVPAKNTQPAVRQTAPAKTAQPKTQPCYYCKGTGMVNAHEYCQFCQGTGYVMLPVQQGNKQVFYPQTNIQTAPANIQTAPAIRQQQTKAPKSAAPNQELHIYVHGGNGYPEPLPYPQIRQQAPANQQTAPAKGLSLGQVLIFSIIIATVLGIMANMGVQ